MFLYLSIPLLSYCLYDPCNFNRKNLKRYSARHNIEPHLARRLRPCYRRCDYSDNYRKRTIKEKSEIIKNAAEKTITAILPVLDDMERAIANMQKSEDAKAWLEGVELINNKFLKILSQEGLNKIETEGADFDTDYHEAIAMIPAPNEEQKGKVLDCVQTGYKLNDKVIRHAKVAVAQ